MADLHIFRLTPEQLDAILAAIQDLPVAERQKQLAEGFINAPYKTSPLGTENSGTLPFIYHQVDCTTLVLLVYALGAAHSLAAAKQWFQKLLYFPDREYEISYTNRIHFTYDRLTRTAFFTPCPLPLPVLQAELTLNTTGPERLLPVNYSRTVTAAYYRFADYTPGLISRFPAGIAFIKSSSFTKGYCISHEGLLLDDSTLVHASRDEQRVVKTNIFSYRGKTTFDGFILFTCSAG